MNVSRVSLCAASIFLHACSQQAAHVAPLDTKPVSCVITPDTLEVVAGASAGLTANFKDSRGLATDAVAVWTSDAPAIAAVDKNGTVTGNGRGEAHVFAQAGSITCAPVRITVKDLRPCSVGLQPASLDLRIGETRKLTATVANCAGDLLPDATVTWASDAPGTVKVDTAGMLTALATGKASIVAGSGAKVSVPAVVTVETNVAAVQIHPSPLPLFVVGDTLPLTVTVLDAAAVTLTGKSANWTSDDNSIVAVDTSGVLHALAVGAVKITATVEGISEHVVATVLDTSPASVTIAPTAVVANIGGTQKMTAVVFNAAGTPIVGAGVTWASDNPAVATIGSVDGIVTAVAYGNARLFATSGTKVSAPATVTVLTSVVAIRISPSPVPIQAPGSSVQLSASVIDSKGAALLGKQPTWTSDNSSSVTVDTSGLAHAVAAGSAIITATVEGKADQVTVTVFDTTPASIVVTPSTLTLKVGETHALNVAVTNAAGDSITDAKVTWATDNAQIASVSTAGLSSGVAYGTAHITASAGTKVSAPVTVTVVTSIAQVKMSPAPIPPIAVGATLQLSVTAADANGVVQTGRIATWQVSDPKIASVSSSGLVTGVGAGQTSVSVFVEGQSDAQPVTVYATPTVSLLEPTSGPPGTRLTIGGAAFGALRGASSVSFDNTQVGTVDLVSWSDTGIVVTVPQVLTLGAHSVTVTVDGHPSNSDRVFTVISPVAKVTLDPPQPYRLTPGDTLSLAFVATDAAAKVLSGRTATWAIVNPAVATVSAAGLVQALSAGTTTVTATVEGVTGSGSLIVERRPVVKSVTPSSGPPLSVLTVSGTDFGATQGTSILEFIPASGSTIVASLTDLSTWSDTQIVLQIPSALILGTYGVRVTVDTLASNQDKTFTLTGLPAVSGIHPKNAPQGASLQMTITGFNLITNQNPCTVSFYRNNAPEGTMTVHPSVADPAPSTGLQQIHLLVDIATYTLPGAVAVACGASNTTLTAQNAFTVTLKEGNISTAAGGSTLPQLGDGTPAFAARLSAPAGLAVGGSGEYYIADTGDNRIRMVNDSASTLTLAGVSVVPGNIATIAGGGGITDDTKAGVTGDNAAATASRLSGPTGLAYDGARKLLYIADTGNCRIRAVNLGTASIALQVGSQTSLSIGGGNIATVAGTTCADAGDYGDAVKASFVHPVAVALPLDGPADAKNLLYILDSSTSLLRVVNTGTSPVYDSPLSLSLPPGMVVPVTARTGSQGDGGPAAQATLSGPLGMGFGLRGLLYISDTTRGLLRVINTSQQATNILGPLPAAGGAGSQILPGAILTAAGTASGGSFQGGDGTPAATTASTFTALQGLTVGPFGEVIVADSSSSIANNNRVRLVNAGDAPVFRLGRLISNASVYTLAGATAAGTSVNGAATSALLSSPKAVAYAAATGALYIADTGNDRIRMVQLVYMHDPASGDQGVWPDAIGKTSGALSAVLDTDLGTLSAPTTATVTYGPTGGVFSFSSPVTIPASVTLTVTGSHLAVIASQQTVTVAGKILVSNGAAVVTVVNKNVAAPHGAATSTPSYGNPLLLPLTPGTTAVTTAGCSPGIGAGAGGLILSAGTDLTVKAGGQISARGASGGYDQCTGWVALGSGGGLRLVAGGTLSVDGLIDTTGASDYHFGAASPGRIRLESNAIVQGASSSIIPTPSTGLVQPTPWF